MKKLFTANFYYFLLFGAVALFSCDKKEGDGPDPDITDISKTTCKLTKASSAGDMYTYESVPEYNAQGYLVKMTEKETEIGNSTTVSTWVTTYTYNASNKLVKETDSDGDYMTLEYNAAGLLIKKTDFASDNTPQWTENYTYDAQGRLAQTVESSNSSTYTYKTTFEYDARGNISKETYYTNNQPDGYNLFEDYDEKFNPYFAVKGLIDPQESKNNYRKRTEVWRGDSNGDGVEEDNTDVETYTYEYNASGFVTKRIEKEVGDDDDVETFTYSGCN